MTRTAHLAILAALVLGAAPAVAHDLWLAPSSFRLTPNEAVRVHLRVGDSPATAEAVPRNPELLIRLSAFDRTGAEAAIPGFDGQDPAGLWKAAQPGTAVLIYEGRPRAIELPAAGFDHYLKEEGLEDILAERQHRGESQLAGRELYSRSVKALVQVGEGAVQDRSVGLPLEFVADSLVPERLEARLLWRGTPMAGAQVKAVALAGEATRLLGRTDRDGRVSFELPRGGRWYLAAVHMERLEPGAAAEWRSTWTSLSFELGGSVATADAGRDLATFEGAIEVTERADSIGAGPSDRRAGELRLRPAAAGGFPPGRQRPGVGRRPVQRLVFDPSSRTRNGVDDRHFHPAERRQARVGLGWRW
jgi:uncharacterized GH25 family protein